MVPAARAVEAHWKPNKASTGRTHRYCRRESVGITCRQTMLSMTLAARRGHPILRGILSSLTAPAVAEDVASRINQRHLAGLLQACKIAPPSKGPAWPS